MQTSVAVDAALMRSALRVSRLKTKRAVAEAGLRLLIQVKTQSKIHRATAISTRSKKN